MITLTSPLLKWWSAKFRGFVLESDPISGFVQRGAERNLIWFRTWWKSWKLLCIFNHCGNMSTNYFLEITLGKKKKKLQALQPACQVLWFTGNYLDFIEHSGFQRLQPTQPLAERHILNSGAEAGLWIQKRQWRDSFVPVQACRVALTLLSFFASRGDGWRTKIRWEDKVRVCHPKKHSLSLSSGTEGTWPILGKTAVLLSAPAAKSKFENLLR